MVLQDNSCPPIFCNSEVEVINSRVPGQRSQAIHTSNLTNV